MSSADRDLMEEEVILLISSAKAKNIDVSIWLTEDENNGMIIAPDFNSKLISLGLIVGMGEENEKKNKLDYAISEVSLRKILAICGKGEDSSGDLLIDVSQFLNICSMKHSKNEMNDSVANSFTGYRLNDSVEMLVTGALNLLGTYLSL